MNAILPIVALACIISTVLINIVLYTTYTGSYSKGECVRDIIKNEEYFEKTITYCKQLESLNIECDIGVQE